MNIKHMYLAGGCFWGLQELFRKQIGVITTRAGYTGGEIENPTYHNHKGHAEALMITYDTSLTGFKELLRYFFRVHNPTTLNQQGNDIGSGYRSAIFYQDKQEYNMSKGVIAIVSASGKWKNKVVTSLEPFSLFWDAEGVHQDYLQKNPFGYTCHVEYFDKY